MTHIYRKKVTIRVHLCSGLIVKSFHLVLENGNKWTANIRSVFLAIVIIISMCCCPFKLQTLHSFCFIRYKYQLFYQVNFGNWLWWTFKFFK